jgi:ABC-type polysaccharide/polyol phosphate export permease
LSASATPSLAPPPPATFEWHGDHLFLIKNLVAKDFRIRYRNMSLGVFWSLLNPLVMMGVLWFIFTRVFPNNTIPNFAVFALCGLIPYNFFSIGLVTGTTSLVDNSQLIKRVHAPRLLIPIATVLANCVQMAAQTLLLLGLVLATGYKINWHWFWLAYLWGFLIVFTTGLALAFSALNVYIRDIRYVVESSNLVLFWLVPIFYPFTMISSAYHEIYRLNPIAAVVLASRHILLEGIAPPPSILWKLPVVSIIVLLTGLAVFRKLQSGFYNHL